MSQLTILKVCSVCELMGIAFGLGVQHLALCLYLSYAWFGLPYFGCVDRFRVCLSYDDSDSCIDTLEAICIHRDVPVLLCVDEFIGDPTGLEYN